MNTIEEVMEWAGVTEVEYEILLKPKEMPMIKVTFSLPANETDKAERFCEAIRSLPEFQP